MIPSHADIEAIKNLVELDLSQNRITGFVNNKGTYLYLLSTIDLNNMRSLVLKRVANPTNIQMLEHPHKDILVISI